MGPLNFCLLVVGVVNEHGKYVYEGPRDLNLYHVTVVML